VRSLLSLGIAWLLGYCGVRLWLPQESAMPRWTIALHAALGIGLGAGFTSTLYWLLVVAGGGTLTVVLGVELVLLAVLAALVRRESKLDAPLIPVDLMRIPIFALSVATSVCSFTIRLQASLSSAMTVSLG